MNRFYNAKFLVDRKQAILVEEKDFTAKCIEKIITNLLTTNILKELQSNCKVSSNNEFNTLNASNNIYELISEECTSR